MDVLTEIDIAVLGAVHQEIDPLIDLLDGCRVFPFRCQTIWVGKYSRLSVLFATTGLGKVNAAVTTASLLEHFHIAQVWNVGCAGTYREGPLHIGDVLITEKSVCGDEGVITSQGVLPVSEIGIPIVARDEELFWDDFPLLREGGMEALIAKTPPGVYRQKRGLPLSRAHIHKPLDRCEAGVSGGKGGVVSEQDHPTGCGLHKEDLFQLVLGPSLTVGMASGDLEAASERFQRYSAFAENMEGSAVVQTCFRFPVPVMECRGISNIAGVRSRETWELEKSIAHCLGIVINWLDTMNSMKSLK
jgi:futalosine hydrolase